MYWGNFLHIYQPPTQKAYWVNRVAQESYSKVFTGLKKDRKAKVTLNINGILSELLIKHGWRSVIDDIRELAERGQLEFTASAKYHAFLPLLPPKEIERQINLNDATNKKIFGRIYNPKGFFPIEMGFNDTVAKVIASKGYSWAIISEFALPQGMVLDRSTMYCHSKYPDLGLFFRDKDISFALLSAEVGVAIETAEQLKKHFSSFFHEKGYMITALDGETFGHHRPGLEQLLFNMYKKTTLRSATLSELETIFQKRAPIMPQDSTWALLHSDIKEKTPYSRWYNPDNAIQMKQWELTHMALTLIKKYPQAKPRKLLDSALHSDQYWWASAQPWWSIEMIELGAKDFVDTIMSFNGISRSYATKAKRLYYEILELAFDWQRSGKIEKLAKDADEDITQRIDKEKPYIPPKEFKKIVDNLTRQMLHSAHAKEYERAAQLRDRIKEWNSKKNEVTKKKKPLA